MTSRTLPWALLVVGAFVWFTVAQRSAAEQGALRERLRLADSTHRSDSLAHQELADSAKVARLLSDSLRSAARREARRDAIAQSRTDSILRETSDARRSASAVLRDSLATISQLRDELHGLIVRSVADSVGMERERAQHQRTVAGFHLALTQDSLTIARSLDAENAAVRRAVSAERQRDVLRQQLPSTVGNVARAGLYLAAGFGLGKILK